MKPIEYHFESVDDFKVSILDSISRLPIQKYNWNFWNKKSSLSALEKSWDFEYDQNGIQNYFRNYWIKSIINETGISIHNHVYYSFGAIYSANAQEEARKEASRYEKRFLDMIKPIR